MYAYLIYEFENIATKTTTTTLYIYSLIYSCQTIMLYFISFIRKYV